MTADRRALWLLSLALCAGCSGTGTDPAGGASGPAPAATAEIDPWLVDVTAEVGLDFRHEAGAAGRFLLPEIMGSGVALLGSAASRGLGLFGFSSNEEVELNR